MADGVVASSFLTFSKTMLTSRACLLSPSLVCFKPVVLACWMRFLPVVDWTAALAVVANALASVEAIARPTTLRLALIIMASWGDDRGAKVDLSFDDLPLR